MSRITGRDEVTVAGGETVRAFLPDPLPPLDPPLDLARLDARLRAAEQGVARLEVAGAMVPALDWFIYAFVRNEAVIAAPLWPRRGARLPTPTQVTVPAHRPDPPYSSTRSPATTSGADTCPSVSTTVKAKS